RLARVRWRERVAHALALVLYALPWLLALPGFVLPALIGTGPNSAEWISVGDFLAGSLLPLLAGSLLPLLGGSILLLGFTDGRAFLQRWRLRLRATRREGVYRARVQRAVFRTVLLALLPGAWAALLPPDPLTAVGPPGRAVLATALGCGFWLLGVALAAVVTFCEWFVGSVRVRPGGEHGAPLFATAGDKPGRAGRLSSLWDLDSENK